MKNVLFLLLALFLFSHCDLEWCPEDEHYGITNLMPITKTYIPDIANKRLFYKNEAGEEWEMIADSLLKAHHTATLAVTCQKYNFPMANNMTQIFIDVERYQLRLMDSTQSLAFHFAWSTNLTEEYTEFDTVEVDTINMLYDDFGMQVKFSDGLRIYHSSLGILTSQRGGNPPLGQWRVDDVHFYQNKEILGKTFQNVYTDTDKEVIFFNKEVGIVSFLDHQGNRWIFDRME